MQQMPTLFISSAPVQTTGQREPSANLQIMLNCQLSLLVWSTDSQETTCKVHQGETEVFHVSWEMLQNLAQSSAKPGTSLLERA